MKSTLKTNLYYTTLNMVLCQKGRVIDEPIEILSFFTHEYVESLILNLIVWLECNNSNSFHWKVLL